VAKSLVLRMLKKGERSTTGGELLERSAQGNVGPIQLLKSENRQFVFRHSSSPGLVKTNRIWGVGNPETNTR
jgi:hypothetical protein